MRILLVEDEKELREALKVILERNNFTVDAVSNGLEALEYINYGDEYDCLVLDIMMPKMDGFGVINKLRENNSELPILILSAKQEIEDRVHGLDLGANDYLVKPFDLEELLARIRVLTRKTSTSNSILSVSNLKLDRRNFSIETNKGKLTLPNKEFQLLELLMSEKNQVIPGDLLFTKIWGYDSDTDINTVWVTISNLRKKLYSINAKVNIKSIRNLGYKLEIGND